MAQSLCITRKSEGMGTQLAADSISLAKAGQFPTRLRAHSRCRSKLGPRHVPPGSSTIGLDLLGVVSGEWSVIALVGKSLHGNNLGSYPEGEGDIPTASLGAPV
jgi:hypothetical protein